MADRYIFDLCCTLVQVLVHNNIIDLIGVSTVKLQKIAKQKSMARVLVQVLIMLMLCWGSGGIAGGIVDTSVIAEWTCLQWSGDGGVGWLRHCVVLGGGSVG